MIYLFNDFVENNVLNLRGQRFDPGFDLQNQVELILDKFISKFLVSNRQNLQIKIIVGKGLSSKKLIKGKNPLRFYTETYLNNMGLSYSSAPEFDGGSGVILVEVS